MTLKRDNEEERLARIEDILARLAEGRVDAEQVPERARSVLAELYSSRKRRTMLVESVNTILKRKPGKKAP